MKRPDISTAQLAKLCGVSQGTVDRALNDRPDIRAETKRKILSTAKQYGYRADVETPSGTELVGQVGIVVFNLNNEYFSKLIMETEYALRKRGYCAVVMMTHYDAQREIECIRELYNMGVAGILLCSVSGGTTFDNYLKLFDIPIVAIGNDIGSIPYVGIDDFAAMRDFAKHLSLEQYDDRIYFSPPLRYPDGTHAQRRRYEGFLSAIGDLPHRVVTDIDKVEKLYEARTVILCSTDYYALQVYARTSGAKITGFDNLDILEKCAFPIDTVGYSISQIADAAVEVLLENKKQGRIFPHTIVEHNAR